MKDARMALPAAMTKVTLTKLQGHKLFMTAARGKQACKHIQHAPLDFAVNSLLHCTVVSVK